MSKVYELPDLPRAPETTIGSLAARLIEFADLTAVQPLIDALSDAGRDHDARQVRATFAKMFVNAVGTSPHLSKSVWRWTVLDLLGVLAFDIFTTAAVLSRIEIATGPYPESAPYTGLVPEDSSGTSDGEWYATGPAPPVTAEGDIPHGAQVEVYFPNPTSPRVRVVSTGGAQ